MDEGSKEERRWSQLHALAVQARTGAKSTVADCENWHAEKEGSHRWKNSAQDAIQTPSEKRLLGTKCGSNKNPRTLEISEERWWNAVFQRVGCLA